MGLALSLCEFYDIFNFFWISNRWLILFWQKSSFFVFKDNMLSIVLSVRTILSTCVFYTAHTASLFTISSSFIEYLILSRWRKPRFFIRIAYSIECLIWMIKDIPRLVVYIKMIGDSFECFYLYIAKDVVLENVIALFLWAWTIIH